MKTAVIVFPILLGISLSAWAQDALTGFDAPTLTAQFKRNNPNSLKADPARPPIVSESKVDPNVSRYILAAASKYGLDPLFVLEILRQESTFRTDAVSRDGAQGIAQLMPDTAARLGVNPFDPVQAIEGGCKVLRSLLLRYNGRADLALAAYNAGEDAVDAYLYGVSRCCTPKGGLINPKKIKTDGIPPYKETQGYVTKIISAYISARGLLLAKGWNPEKVGIEQISFLIPHKTRNAEPIPAARRFPHETELLLDDFSAMTGIAWRTSRQTWIDRSLSEKRSQEQEEPGLATADTASSVSDMKLDVIWKTGDLRRPSHPKRKEIEP